MHFRVTRYLIYSFCFARGKKIDKHSDYCELIVCSTVLFTRWQFTRPYIKHSIKSILTYSYMCLEQTRKLLTYILLLLF